MRRPSAPFALALLLPVAAQAQTELPGPPASELADPEEHRGATFGTDLSIGTAGGMLLGAWTVASVHSSFGFRFDAFATGRAGEGPRIGLSLFGEHAAGLLPRAEEEQDDERVEFPFSYLHWGVLCALRPDPALPWGGLAAIGFSRMDLDPYYGGSYPVPLLIFEGGVRRSLGRAPSRVFLDFGLRAGWTQIRDPSETLDELWLAQLSVGLGLHLR